MGKWKLVCLLLITVLSAAQLRAESTTSEDEIALALANMLRAGRTVIASNQAVINNPGTGKDLTGARVRDAAIQVFKDKTGADPDAIIANNRYGKLLAVGKASGVEYFHIMAQPNLLKQGTDNHPVFNNMAQYRRVHFCTVKFYLACTLGIPDCHMRIGAQPL